MKTIQLSILIKHNNTLYNHKLYFNKNYNSKFIRNNSIFKLKMNQVGNKIKNILSKNQINKKAYNKLIIIMIINIR